MSDENPTLSLESLGVGMKLVERWSNGRSLAQPVILVNAPSEHIAKWNDWAGYEKWVHP